MDSENAIYLRVANEQDRVTVASILFKNGYTVMTARKRKPSKAADYYIRITRESPDLPEDAQQ